MQSKVASGIFVVVLLAAWPARGGSPKPSSKSVGEGLTCQCGCGQTVTGCNHLECSARTEMQAQIEKEIAAGKSETTILQDFVLRYGVKVLATPPATGFNLTVWILPAACLVAGLVFVVWVTRRWRKPAVRLAGRTPGPLDPKVLAAVEEEMKVTGFGARD